MKDDSKDLEIGFATIQYDEDGRAIDASFQATMKLQQDNSLLERLVLVTASTDVAAMQDNARSVFGKWFSKTNEIELADHSEYRVDDELVECTKYDNDRPKKCVFRFVYRKVGEASNASNEQE